MKKIFVVVFVIFFPSISFSEDTSSKCLSESINNQIPHLVNDKIMAKNLAEIYVRERYGEDNAQREKPYIVEDKCEFWKISGSMEPNAVGGVFIIEIDKLNGKIRLFEHGK